MQICCVRDIRFTNPSRYPSGHYNEGVLESNYDLCTIKRGHELHPRSSGKRMFPCVELEDGEGLSSRLSFDGKSSM
jgi:hypothetical protein